LISSEANASGGEIKEREAIIVVDRGKILFMLIKLNSHHKVTVSVG
jgi:hypothetical protein